MQERRKTVRMPCVIAAEYAPIASPPGEALEPLPIPARLTNLSLHGAGVLSSRRLALGDRIRLQFSLPQDGERLRLDGQVRWIEELSGGSRRHAAGIEFGQLDDTMRFCLTTFAQGRTRHPVPEDPRPLPALQRLRARLATPTAKRMQLAGLAVLVAVLVGAIALLQRTRQQLRQHVADRTRVIEQLESHHEVLLAHLHATEQRTDALTRELAELRNYSLSVEARAALLAEQLEQTRQEYTRVADDRAQLRRELDAAMAQQQALEARFRSLPDLRQAIHDAMQAQRRQMRLVRQGRVRLVDQQALAMGNRGYVIQNPPAGESPVEIRVHQPEIGNLPAVAATEVLSGDP